MVLYKGRFYRHLLNEKGEPVFSKENLMPDSRYPETLPAPEKPTTPTDAAPDVYCFSCGNKLDGEPFPCLTCKNPLCLGCVERGKGFCSEECASAPPAEDQPATTTQQSTQELVTTAPAEVATAEEMEVDDEEGGEEDEEEEVGEDPIANLFNQ